MLDGARLMFPAPLYVVTAPLGPMSNSIQPAFIVDEPQPGTFDDELLPALVGVWYAMHLPKNRFETLDMPLRAIKDQVNGFPRAHSIALVPDALLEESELMDRLTVAFDPTLIITSADRIETAQKVSARIGFALSPACVDSLDQSTLDEHWRLLASGWYKDWPRGVTLDPSTPRWSWPIGQDGSRLSLQRLARMMAVPVNLPDDQQSPFVSAAWVRNLRVRLDALLELENQGVDPECAAGLFSEAMRKQSSATRTRLAVSLSGTARPYARFSSGGDGTSRATFEDNYPQVRSLLVAHSASADNSMGIVLEDALTPQAFQALADLERHWTDGARPVAVQRILRRLNSATSGLWNDDFVAAIRRASSIDAFTNFPLGLLTLPGDSSPLSTRLPISYRTINPLTRALQLELSPQVPRSFQAGFKVLVAECLPSSDPIGRASRQGWQTISDEMSEAGVDLTITETLTKDALRSAIASSLPDVLVLSAHGFYAPDSNIAGLTIGEDEISLGDDLGAMPPLVVLSACHTSPRGRGVVNVGDLLLRSGADAVLSTLVPVDVRHNAQTTARFFRYLAVLGREVGYRRLIGGRPLSAVWRRRVL